MLCDWRADRQFADAILHERLAQSSLSSTDRAFTTELVYGVLRNLRLLDFWIDRLRSKSLDLTARDLLRLGLYQVLIADVAEHAAVSETVTLAAPRLRGLVNGVLRSAIRGKRDLLDTASATSLAIRTSHPDFIVERWTKNFGEENAAALCEWNNQPPPLYLRVNQLKANIESFGCARCDRLAGYRGFFRCEEIPREVVARGECYIQDPSTRLACALLDPRPNEHVLDACAAPGGKTSLIAEIMQNSGTLVAIDRDPARVAVLRDNLNRLGVTCAEVRRCDWTKPESCRSIPATGSFDRILVDAPCSNTGVMRRRVDVRWRLSADEFAHMQTIQLSIVAAVLPLLKPGGILVYSTCSIESEENEQVVARLAADFPTLQLVRQQSLLPFRDHVDGAFAAQFSLRHSLTVES